MASASPAQDPVAPPPEEPPHELHTLRETTARYLAEVVYRLVIWFPPSRVAARRLVILVGAGTSAELLHRAIEHLR
jgi:hypothetical protein